MKVVESHTADSSAQLTAESPSSRGSIDTDDRGGSLTASDRLVSMGVGVAPVLTGGAAGGGGGVSPPTADMPANPRSSKVELGELGFGSTSSMHAPAEQPSPARVRTSLVARAMGRNSCAGGKRRKSLADAHGVAPPSMLPPPPAEGAPPPTQGQTGGRGRGVTRRQSCVKRARAYAAAARRGLLPANKTNPPKAPPIDLDAISATAKPSAM